MKANLALCSAAYCCKAITHQLANLRTVTSQIMLGVRVLKIARATKIMTNINLHLANNPETTNTIVSRGFSP